MAVKKQSQMSALAMRAFNEQKAICLRPGASVTDDEFRHCLRYFRVGATTNSKDVISAGDPGSAVGEISAIHTAVLSKSLDRIENIHRQIPFIFRAAKRMADESGRGTFAYNDRITKDVERINEDAQNSKDRYGSPNRNTYMTHLGEAELAASARSLATYLAPELIEKSWHEAVERDLKFSEADLTGLAGVASQERLNSDSDFMLRSIALYKILHTELLVSTAVEKPQTERGFSGMLWLLEEFQRYGTANPH
jgi:hypothetical protein